MWTRKTIHMPQMFELAFFSSSFRKVLLGLCLAAVFCIPRFVAAANHFSPEEGKQEKPYALIFGTVWGPDERPVYGVKIKIRRDGEKKARWEQYSDHSGEFAQRVPAGKQDYVIWADLKGLKSTTGHPLRGEEVKVHVDGDERADTGLHLQ
jgi:hypothetical protein